SVTALSAYDASDGAGQCLYAGGSFLVTGTQARNVARWNGTRWEWGLSDWPNGRLQSLEVFDPDGPGGVSRSLLAVGGSFTSVGAQSLAGVATWDGVQWSSLAGGLAGVGSFGPVVNRVLPLPSDGVHGVRLIAVGQFASAGGSPSGNLALLVACPRCAAD